MMGRIERQQALLERAKTVLQFLATNPTDSECQEYIDNQEYNIISNKPASVRLVIFAGLNVSAALKSIEK